MDWESQWKKKLLQLIETKKGNEWLKNKRIYLIKSLVDLNGFFFKKKWVMLSDWERNSKKITKLQIKSKSLKLNWKLFHISYSIFNMMIIILVETSSIFFFPEWLILNRILFVSWLPRIPERTTVARTNDLSNSCLLFSLSLFLAIIFIVDGTNVMAAIFFF